MGREVWYVPKWSAIRGQIAEYHSFSTKDEAATFAQTSEWYGAPMCSGLCCHCDEPLPPSGSCWCRSTWSGGRG